MATNIGKLGDAPDPVFNFAPTLGRSINVGTSGIIVHITTSLVYVCYVGSQIQLADSDYGYVSSYSQLPGIDELETTFLNRLQSVYTPFVVRWTQAGKTSYVNLGTRSQYRGSWNWFQDHTALDYNSYQDITWTCEYAGRDGDYAEYYLFDFENQEASSWPTWHVYRTFPAFCLDRIAFSG